MTAVCVAAKKTPRLAGAVPSGTKEMRLRGDLFRRAVDHLRGLLRAAGRDRDRAGFLGFGDLANEVDMEQTVLQRRVLHLHEIGKLEHALEGARGDAAIEHFGILLAVLIGDLLALDGQGVFLGDDGEFALRETGDRDADAIGVLAGALDIVGRIAGAAVGGCLIEQVEKTVEADGGTIKRGEIVGAHGSPPLSDWFKFYPPRKGAGPSSICSL